MLKQPDFDAAVHDHNIAFRNPLQLFGLGLIEGIQDSAIRTNMAANQGPKRAIVLDEMGLVGSGVALPSRRPQRDWRRLRISGWVVG